MVKSKSHWRSDADGNHFIPTGKVSHSMDPKQANSVKGKTEKAISEEILRNGIIEVGRKLKNEATVHVADPDEKTSHLANQIAYMTAELIVAARQNNRKEIRRISDKLYNHLGAFHGGQKVGTALMMSLLEKLGDDISKLGAIVHFYNTKQQVKSIEDAHW